MEFLGNGGSSLQWRRGPWVYHASELNWQKNGFCLSISTLKLPQGMALRVFSQPCLTGHGGQVSPSEIPIRENHVKPLTQTLYHQHQKKINKEQNRTIYHILNQVSPSEISSNSLELDAKNRRGDPEDREAREDRSAGSGGASLSPGGSVGSAMAASLSPASRVAK